MKYRALITGATGFVGGYVAECLHAEGWHVSAVVRSTSQRDVLPPTVRDDMQFYDADQMPLLEIVRTAAPDVVFHLATYYTTEHSPAEIDALIPPISPLGQSCSTPWHSMAYKISCMRGLRGSTIVVMHMSR